jgi:hypothetical protein
VVIASCPHEAPIFLSTLAGRNSRFGSRGHEDVAGGGRVSACPCAQPERTPEQSVQAPCHFLAWITRRTADGFVGGSPGKQTGSSGATPPVDVAGGSPAGERIRSRPPKPDAKMRIYFSAPSWRGVGVTPRRRAREGGRYRPRPDSPRPWRAARPPHCGSPVRTKAVRHEYRPPLAKGRITRNVHGPRTNAGPWSSDRWGLTAS